MKKLLTFLAFAGCLVSFTPAHAEDVKRTDRDIVTYNKKGSTEVALGVSSGGIVYSQEGLVNIRENLLNIVAPSTFSIAEVIFSSADVLSLAPTNFSLAPSNTWVRYRTQPAYPSPIWIQFWFNSSFSTNSFSAPVTISGIDSTGSSRTVTVTVSTGSNSRSYTTGIAFTHISTVSVGLNTSTTTIRHGAPLHLVLGTTNQIGLANDLVSDGDVYAVWENRVAQSSITANGDFNTFTPNALPNAFSTTTVNGLIRIPIGNFWEVLYRARQSPPRKLNPGRAP